MWSERINKPLPGVPLNSWSATLDNVRWSNDGIIAVGGAEHVMLLVLKFVTDEDKHWDVIDIRVNVFTDEEVPLMLPLSWKSFSVGQEQSESFCTSLAWSPPGIAKHRRSALAVLTANHVLAIWECVGKPEVSADWVRVYIVNHALRDFAASGERSNEMQTAAQRIRSFAWSPGSAVDITEATTGASPMLETPYLAVSNDAGDVIILKVTSPHDVLSPESRHWTCSVVHSYVARPGSSKKVPLLSCLPSASQDRKTFVDQVSWSPWSRDSTGALSSILATTTQSSLECKVVRLDASNLVSPIALGPSLPRIVDESVAFPAGRMRWMDKPTADGEMYLLYPCRKVLYCLVFHLRKAFGIRVTKQPLDNVWDEVSGLAFNADEHGRPAVQLTYNLNSATAQNLHWPLPLSDVQPLLSPPWQQRLRETEAIYSQDNGLDGHAMTRTYGIDTSPFGDFAALNSSIHPTDGLEYIIASDHLSSVHVVPTRPGYGSGFLLAKGGVSWARDFSAEAALFSLQRYTERFPDDPNIDQTIQAPILQTSDLGNTLESAPDNTHIIEGTPAHVIARRVRDNILFQRPPVTSRARLLSSLRKGQIPRRIAPDLDVVRAVVSETASLPHYLGEASELSQVISRIHNLVLAKLSARDGQSDQSHNLSDQDIETCGICNSGIAFESLRWARCPNGHLFTRCALSFVSIQTPGTAKFCGICNTQYLNENFIFDIAPSPKSDVTATDLPPEQDGDQWVMLKQGTMDKEPVMSLARILFWAVDRCVCCGGKFVG